MDRENNLHVKPFFMFMCSLLPGCAHMYLGLLKRGIQLLLAFLLLIGFAATFYGLEFILIPVIVVLYVYSFFDGYSIYRNIKAGNNVEDESVIEGLDSVRKIVTNGYWIGVTLLILGVIVGFQSLRYAGLFNDTFYRLFDLVQEFIPAVLLLGFGIFLMSKGNKNRKKDKEEKQITE